MWIQIFYVPLYHKIVKKQHLMGLVQNAIMDLVIQMELASKKFQYLIVKNLTL